MTIGTPAHRDVPGPLSGLRIIELSSYVATPLSGLVLAQLGADVIRVEQLGGAPDRTRLPRAASGTSLYWSGLNKGKRAVAVDLERPEGRALVADLVVGEGAGTGGGILVSNSDRWPELSFDGLARRRADAIQVLLTGRRDGGSAVDYVLQAGTGFSYVTGPRGAGVPTNMVVPAWDLAAGLYLATGLLAAVHERNASGSGQRVHVALDEIPLAIGSALGYLAEAQLSGIDRGPSGNDVFGTYGRDFVTSDGVRFMLVVLSRSHWRRLVAATGLDETIAALEKALAVDLDDEGERYAARTVISALLEKRFAALTWSEARELLAGTRALVEPFRTFDELVESDLVQANPLFTEVDQPGVGPHLAAGSPISMGGRQAAATTAPAVGEHTDDVLATVAGVDVDRLERLRADGVVA